MSPIDTYTAAIERALATTRLGRARINAIVGEQRDLLEELASEGASLSDELGTPRDYAASVAREYELRGLSRTASMAEAREALTRAFHTTFETYDWTLPALAGAGSGA